MSDHPTTNTLTIDVLALRESQSITLSYHDGDGCWWAVLWEEAGNSALLASQCATPVAALAELLVEMGRRPDLTN